MAGKFQIKKRDNGEFQFNLDADNGQTILTSQGYAAKASCQVAVESVRKNSQDDARFDRKLADNGKHYFVLTAGNGEVIGNSQMYADVNGRDTGIASVRSHAAQAEVVDGTV